MGRRGKATFFLGLSFPFYKMRGLDQILKFGIIYLLTHLPDPYQAPSV